MELFKVIRKYRFLGKDMIALATVKVIKETPMNYLVESSYITDHHSRIPKDNIRGYALTPVSAWQKYIAKAEQQLAVVNRQGYTLTEELEWARVQLEMHIKFTALKIGGTH